MSEGSSSALLCDSNKLRLLFTAIFSFFNEKIKETKKNKTIKKRQVQL